jgi:TonB family protein
MRARGSILRALLPLVLIPLALLVSLGATSTTGQEAAQPTESSGFVVGVDTYFDFGPPNNYYEIFIVIPAQHGTKVQRFILRPLAHKCYAPEEVAYVEKTSTLSVKDLLAGVDPCKIREKDLKKEQKRKKGELNFSGANVSLQLSCAGETRTIQTSVLERDWFLASPGTPRNTSWTVELLDKLRSLTGPGVLDQPMFPPKSYTRAPVSADPLSLENLSSGKYDSLFPDPEEKASEIYRGSLVPPPQPTVKLISGTPLEPVHFTLPAYPSLPWMIGHEGEPSVVVRLDPRGNVSSVVMFTGYALFEAAIRDAVKDWIFPPAPPSTEILDPPRDVTLRFSFQLNCKPTEDKK